MCIMPVLVFAEYFINQDLFTFSYEQEMTLGMNLLSFYSELVWVIIPTEAK